MRGVTSRGRSGAAARRRYPTPQARGQGRQVGGATPRPHAQGQGRRPGEATPPEARGGGGEDQPQI